MSLKVPKIGGVAVPLFLLRVQGRSRWRSWIGVAVVIGGIAGVLIAMFAGARRTETAYNRFVGATAGFDFALTNGGTTPDNLNRQFDFEEVADLPEVADVAVTNYYFAYGTTPSGRQIVPNDLSPLASVDGKFGKTLNRAQIIDGRSATAEDEIAVTVLAARRLDIAVGDVLSLYLGGTGALAGPPADAHPRPYRVVGVIAMQAGIPPFTGGLPPPALLAPAYARSHPDAGQVLFARLHQGRHDVAAFNRQLARLAPNQPIVSGNGDEFAGVDRSLSVQANALRIVAALVCIVILLVSGQVLALMSASHAAEYDTFRVLGITRRELRAVELQRSFVLAGIATMVAIGAAIALSPLSPIGLARELEPDPGIDLNGAYVALGALATFALVSALGFGSALVTHRRSTGRSNTTRHLRIALALANAGASPAATTGVTMAIEPGGGRAAVPSRSTIVTATLAIAVVVGVLAFAASLGNLFEHPKLYGWNWDVQIGDAFAPALDDEAARIASDPGAEAVAVGTTARVDLANTQVDLLAIESRKGSVLPTIVAGRAAAAPDEIVLGTRTLRVLDRRVGDNVDIELGETQARFRIVGRAVFPEPASAARLGDGAATTLRGVRRLQADLSSDVILVRRTPDAAGTALLDGIKAQRGRNLYLPEKPADLAELGRIGGLPSVLAASLAGIAVVTVAAALVSSVIRRRRDLAILKALGFGSRQLSASVAWQSNVIALVAIVLGVPLGIVCGWLSWRWFAVQLGVPPRPTISGVGVAAVVIGTLVLANVVAFIPARLAARTETAAVLRTA
jgi:ABC-type lipoprotein release transport system permease subunit